MNKQLWRFMVSMALCFLLVQPVGFAETTEEGSADTASLLEDIKTFIHNLGLNIGYEVDPNINASQPNPPKNTLITEPTDQLKSIAQYSFYSLFGAIPVNAFLGSDSKEGDAGIYIPFLPTDSKVEAVTPYIEPLNLLANQTFPDYMTAGSTPLSASELIDQPTYQPDPVNQLLLNILTTPDKTYCMNNEATEWMDCNLLYQTKVMSNAVGTLPATDTYFTYDYQAPFLSDLNGNTLIAPLLYTTTAGTTTQEDDVGLLATNQVEAAANFIRYVTGAVQPAPTIKREDYSKQLAAAYPYGTKPIPDDESDQARTDREKALATLTNYVTKVRMYAAKNSVAMSNLYYILSKRLPQKDLGDSSRAFNEFQMATRRQYDPTKDATQWLDSINTASPATVQKEMAILLSEINYQLYLNRQQDERLLLTNTLILLNSIASDKPPTTLSTEDQ